MKAVSNLPKRRADALLVDRGLAPSRERAMALILEGRVYSGQQAVTKPGNLLASETPLRVTEGARYVSRGGLKLEAGLRQFALDVAGQIALDMGASTGGFTECLLQHGARLTYAVDVGYGQLDQRLRADPRVVVMERVNARYPFALSQQVDLVTADVSFISLTLVLPQALAYLRPGGRIIALVKPQFEARRREVGRGGVVLDPKVQVAVLARFFRWAIDLSLRVRGVVSSPILGDAGNREFLVLLQKPI